MDGELEYIYILAPFKDPLHGIVLFLFRTDTVTLFTVSLRKSLRDKFAISHTFLVFNTRAI